MGGGRAGSGLGTHVHPWQIHVNVWQNQCSIVKCKKKKKKKDHQEKQPTNPNKVLGLFTEKKKMDGEI